MRVSYFRGQALNEYTLILGIVFAGLLTMQTFIKRGIQGVIKVTADDLGEPAKQAYNLSSQKVGVMEKGLVNYNLIQPLEIQTERNITLSESDTAPIRTVTINKDATTTTGKWQVAYHLGQEVSQKIDKPEKGEEKEDKDTITLSQFENALKETAGFYRKEKRGNLVYYTKVSRKDDPNNGRVLAVIDTKKKTLTEYDGDSQPVIAYSIKGNLIIKDSRVTFQGEKGERIAQDIIRGSDGKIYIYKTAYINGREVRTIKTPLPAGLQNYLEKNGGAFEVVNDRHIVVYTDKTVLVWQRDSGVKEYSVVRNGYDKEQAIVRDRSGRIYDYRIIRIEGKEYVKPTSPLSEVIQKYIEDKGGYFEKESNKYYHFNEYGQNKELIFIIQKGSSITRYEKGIPKETLFMNGKERLTYSMPQEKDGRLIVVDNTGKEWLANKKYYETERKTKGEYFVLKEKPRVKEEKSLSKEEWHPAINEYLEKNRGGFIVTKIKGDNIYYYHTRDGKKKTLIAGQDKLTGDFTGYDWEGFPTATVDKNNKPLRKYTRNEDPKTGKAINVTDSIGRVYRKHQIIRITEVPN